MKKVLVVGSGGREHALGWRLSRDRVTPELWFAPGNAGTAALGRNVPIPADAIDELVDWARENRPSLVVVGPEAPLCDGLADALEAVGILVFGPRRDGARLEGSKAFAKTLMREAGVPTAESVVCTTTESARRAIEAMPEPLVVKADGLAAGKGVFVCETRAEARQALDGMMTDRCFGDAGATVVVEECLRGEEASLLALVDGERAVMLPAAQDHKRACDGDRGPNTGGMGAYSPTPVVSPALAERIHDGVIRPMIAALHRRRIQYRGVLYAGLMLTDEGPKVLEFNCRFGDPETQVILPRLDGDFLPLLTACASGRLHEAPLPAWRPEACVGVVMTAGGYPGPYRRGLPISGLTQARACPGVEVFHAGTLLENDRTLTAGGRVLNVVAQDATLQGAIERAYKAVGMIAFEGAAWRRDIARRAL